MKRPGACHPLLICEISRVYRARLVSYERCYKITKEYTRYTEKQLIARMGKEHTRTILTISPSRILIHENAKNKWTI